MYTPTHTRTYHLIAHTLSEVRTDIVVARKEVLEMSHQKTQKPHPPTHTHNPTHTYPHPHTHVPLDSAHTERENDQFVGDREVALCERCHIHPRTHTAHAHILTTTHAHTQAHAHILTHLHVRTTWQRTY